MMGGDCEGLEGQLHILGPGIESKSGVVSMGEAVDPLTAPSSPIGYMETPPLGGGNVQQ